LGVLFRSSLFAVFDAECPGVSGVFCCDNWLSILSVIAMVSHDSAGHGKVWDLGKTRTGARLNLKTGITSICDDSGDAELLQHGSRQYNQPLGSRRKQNQIVCQCLHSSSSETPKSSLVPSRVLEMRARNES